MKPSRKRGLEFVIYRNLSTQRSTFSPTVNPPSEEESSLVVTVDFEDGTSGRVVFCEEGISFENLGACRFNVGVIDSETEFSLNGKSLCYTHNGFSYSLTAVGEITPTAEGFSVDEKNDRWMLKV